MVKTNVLVTGAKGQLAQTIRELYFKNQDNIQFTFVDKTILDITNANAVDFLLKTHTFNYCINCAAYTNVEQAEESVDLAFKINAEGARNLASACKENNVVLIHISTDYVFDGNKGAPYKETDVTNPLNEYGKSKLLGEQYISQILDSHFIIRTSWLYSEYGKNFLKTIVNKIKENTSLKITTAELGTPTSCVDLAGFIYYLIISKNQNFGIYHFSNEGEATWFDFGKEIAKYFKGYNIFNISPVNTFKTKARRPKYSILSKDKVKKIKSEDIKDWRESLKYVINEFKR